ncbi:MAG: beta-lactamase family protein [Deltaproteobacteria bacterium]|nr:beta-lactamase family protein [Deltaproteobacteria bacterium]
MEALLSEIDAVLAEGRIPSISLNIRVDGREVFHATRGRARTVPLREASDDQAYDLASVTKALAGTTVLASLVEEGRLDLDTRVRRWFPQVHPDLEVRHLLQHSSGWPAWRPFYGGLQATWGTTAARRELLAAVLAVPSECAPGTRHLYSDIGFLCLLGLAEAETGQRFDALFLERVLAPAGYPDLRWGWPAAAATELCPHREILIEGTVHDLNCASIGGVSAHAGLFGTARGVAALADALLQATGGASNGLPGRTLHRLWNTPGPGSHTAGWDRPSEEGYTSTGRFFPRDARGHLGYTGTSLWVVPSRSSVIALLTNRVHPVDDKEPIRAARPRLHDAVARALGWDRSIA